MLQPRNFIDLLGSEVVPGRYFVANRVWYEDLFEQVRKKILKPAFE